MLTVIIPSNNEEEKLVRTFAHLISHAVSGLVTEVCVYDSGSTDRTEKVCDVAGAQLINATDMRPDELIRAAKGHWLLILPPGAGLSHGWASVVEAHINAPNGAGAARFRLSPNYNVPWWMRLFRPLRAKGTFGKGYLISKSGAVQSIGKSQSLEAVANGRAVRVLPAEITPA